MPARKIAISLPAAVAAAVAEDAAARGETVSGWLSDAAARKLRRVRAQALLAEFEAARGPLTPAERRAARKLWPG